MKNQQSKIKAVLCDMDGTLVDSNALHAEAWQRTFQHYGITVSFREALHQIGKGSDQLIPLFVPKADLERLTKPLETYRKELFHAEYFSKIKAFPCSRELLLKMKSIGLRIAIASSASKEDLTRLKEVAGITDLVEEETSSDDADRSKPSPDIFAAALDRLELGAGEALALGDTPWDIEAALKAGMRTIAVCSGGWAEDELRKAGALEIYKDVEQLHEEFEDSAFSTRVRGNAV